MDQIEEIAAAVASGAAPIMKDRANLRDCASRIARVIGELASLQSELMRAANEAEGVQARLIGFFSQPITARVPQPVRPYTPLSTGVHLGFEEGANVQLSVEPKLDHSLSPEACLNTVTLRYGGGSRYLSLEAYCSWLDFAGAQRYQLGIYAEPDRVVSCQAVLRLPQKGGEFDVPLSTFDLRPDDRACNPSGSFRLPDDREIDRERYPLLLLLFDTERDLQIRLDYINIYFA